MCARHSSRSHQTRTRDSAKRTHYRLTFVVLAASVSAYAMLQSLVIPVLPLLSLELGVSQSATTWVLTSYLLSASVFTPIMGRLGDMVGKRRVLVATLFVLAFGSLLGAMATSLPVMIAARAIQGIGGGTLSLAFGIVRDEFPPEKMTGAIASIGSLAAVGSGVGIVLAGPVVAVLNYHWLFWLPMILTMGSAVAAHLLIPESLETSPGRINWIAAIFLSGWLISLLLGVSQGPSWGWTSWSSVGMFTAAAFLLLVWVLAERGSTTPLIDLDMLAQRAVWTNNLVVLLVGAALYAVFAYLPALVQTDASEGYGFGASITEAGLMLGPLGLFMFVLGQATGLLVRRVGARALVIGGALLGALAMLLLAFAHGEKWEIYLAMTLMGVGFGVLFAAMSCLIVVAVPPSQTGVAAGMNANIRTIGGSVGAAVFASVVMATEDSRGVPAEAGFTAGFTILTTVMLASAVAAVAIPSRRRVDLYTAAGREQAVLAPVPGGTIAGPSSSASD